MEEIAQGRLWTGDDAASKGLVDAIGGFSRAVAIAKHKAKIPQHKKVASFLLSVSFEWLIKETKLFCILYFFFFFFVIIL